MTSFFDNHAKLSKKLVIGSGASVWHFPPFDQPYDNLFEVRDVADGTRVKQALRDELERNGVTVLTDTAVSRLAAEDGRIVRAVLKQGDKETEIPADMVINSAGIYLPGELGVRIEDLMLMTPDGAVSLNHVSKELEVIQ